MNAQTPQSTWQSIGDLVAALVQKETRQRANAPGQTSPEIGETGMARTKDSAAEGEFQ